MTISLNNNLTASAIACKLPQIPTTLGPRRRWTDAINFRSANVKNATIGKANNTDNTKFAIIFV